MSQPNTTFATRFESLTEHPPFPWQEALFERLMEGELPSACDLPTGLGKTSVMAIWWLARSAGASLPRRLVYVVDRRAVVDQATQVAEQLRKYVEEGDADIPKHSLPISTLRGQHVDNKAWLENPTTPAIIVGTVDMVGSRLLFEGYGVSRRMRPYHAGLMGADTLIVLDEAHLVPPFEALLARLEEDVAEFGPDDEAVRARVPAFRLMSLSATGRSDRGDTFGLQPKDMKDKQVLKRLGATRRLRFHPLDDSNQLADRLAEQAWQLADVGESPARVLIFANSRTVAGAAKLALEKLARQAKCPIESELFVGSRRVKERTLAAGWLEQCGFMATDTATSSQPTFLFATSAGEVGVDLDANHMVCDLVAWERMVQRLGRVNRRGEGAADVVVVADLEGVPDKAAKKAFDKAVEKRTPKDLELIATFERHRAVLKALRLLPDVDGHYDASPGAIRDLKIRADKQSDAGASLRSTLSAATSSEPLRPELTRAVVDAWSLTSLKEHTGRPLIQPWLRGWVNDDPQTRVVWRTHLPRMYRPGHAQDGQSLTSKQTQEFFDAATPHLSEVLETDTRSLLDWLIKRVTASLKADNDKAREQMHDRLVAVILTSAGDVSEQLTIGELIFDGSDKKGEDRRKAKLMSTLASATLVVDAALGGLLESGLLDDKVDVPPQTADDGFSWLLDEKGDPVVPFRIRLSEKADAAKGAGWRESLRVPRLINEDGEPTSWLIIEQWRGGAVTEDVRSIMEPQLLVDHQADAGRRAGRMATELGLSPDETRMLVLAAECHDEGKAADRWQRAFSAKDDGLYAKTSGPLKLNLLDGYRHELGTLLAIKQKPELAARFDQLPTDLRDLALHLIAAHHGYARPVIGTSGCDAAPPSQLDGLAQEIALRFSRLQRQWGPWGLAWWESLLRAADQQASREPGSSTETERENPNG